MSFVGAKDVNLSEKELAVLQAIADGRTYRQASAELAARGRSELLTSQWAE